MARNNGYKLISTWFDRCLHALALVASFILIFVTFAISCDVIVRYLFGVSMAWAFNVSQHLLLFLVFLAAAWVQREGAHVKIDMVEERLSKRRRDFLRLTTSFLSMVACTVLFWSGSNAALQSFRWGTMLPGPPPVYEYLLLAVIPFGSLLLTIQFARDCWNHINKLRRGS